MKRYILAVEIVVIALLLVLITLDFTGVGRKQRQQYKEIDHISPKATPGIVSLAPLNGQDKDIWRKDGDELVPPTPTPTPTPIPPTPTPTLTPEQQKLKDQIDAATAYTIPEGIAFADVSDYLSIRREPDGNAARLGIMNPGDSCIVESVDGEWAYVRSGTVKGYCKASFLIRGDAGVQYAKEHIVYTVTITGNVNVRSEPTTQEDNVFTSLEIGKVVTARTPAVRSKDDPTTPLFIEIELIDGRTGYIASNKATITSGWPTGKPIDDRKTQ